MATPKPKPSTGKFQKPKGKMAPNVAKARAKAPAFQKGKKVSATKSMKTNGTPTKGTRYGKGK